MLCVGIGGGLGSMLRYLTSVFTSKFFPLMFPLATFIVNIVGCFLIGALIGLSGKNILVNNQLLLLLTVGFCGGYTTFSTFSAESLSLFSTGNSLMACAYIAGSVLLGLGAVWLGTWVAVRM
ncbi:fluoride efflux transporter CrcB [Bacteroidales bacterium OttesenSCG-928-E04]|nr:fluoride efflux transporter CrcB [Bacteroidales bacterium OttesenSCG-928-E04]MDL2326624.1 fluoride efflux transporter CrcB [Bacteroidales bacterium OttesenSCG-928-A14]